MQSDFRVRPVNFMAGLFISASQSIILLNFYPLIPVTIDCIQSNALESEVQNLCAGHNFIAAAIFLGLMSLASILACAMSLIAAGQNNPFHVNLQHFSTLSIVLTLFPKILISLFFNSQFSIHFFPFLSIVNAFFFALRIVHSKFITAFVFSSLDFFSDIGNILLFWSSVASVVINNIFPSDTGELALAAVALLTFLSSLLFYQNKSEISFPSLPSVLNLKTTCQLYHVIQLAIAASEGSDSNYQSYLHQMVTDSLLKISQKSSFKKSRTHKQRSFLLLNAESRQEISGNELLDKLCEYIETLINQNKINNFADLAPFYHFVIFYYLDKKKEVAKVIALFFSKVFKENDNQLWIANKFSNYMVIRKISIVILAQERARQEESSQFCLVEYTRFENLQIKFKQTISVSVTTYLKFLNEFNRDVPKMKIQQQRVKRIQKYSEKIDQLLKKILRADQLSKSFLKLYYAYTDCVLFDQSKLRQIRVMAASLMIKKNFLMNRSDIKNLELNKEVEKFFLMLSTDRFSNGRIDQASQESKKFFKLPLDMIVNQPLDQVKPTFMKGFSSYVIDALLNPESSSDPEKLTSFLDFYCNSEGHLKAAITSAKLFPVLTDGLRIMILSSSVKFMEPKNSGMAIVDMDSGRLHHCSRKFLDVFESLFGTEFNNANHTVNWGDLSNLEIEIQFKESDRTSLLMGRTIELSFLKKSNSIEIVMKHKSRETPQKAFAKEASMVISMNHSSPGVTFEQSLESLSSETQDNAPSIVTGLLVVSLEWPSKNFALIRFDKEKYNQKSLYFKKIMIQKSMNDLTPQNVLNDDKSMVSSRTEYNLKPLNSLKKPPASLLCKILSYLFIVFLAFKTALCILLIISFNDHFHFSDIVIRESKYLETKFDTFISVFDNLSVVIFEDAIRSKVPQYEIDTDDLKITILNDLESLKANELLYDMLVAEYMKNVNLLMPLNQPNLESNFSSTNSLMFFAEINVQSPNATSAKLNFNLFTYYFATQVKNTLESKDTVGFAYLRRTLCDFFDNVGRRMEQDYISKIFAYDSYKQSSFIINLIGLFAMIGFVLVLVIIIVILEGSMHEPIYHFCYFTHLDIAEFAKLVVEFSVAFDFDIKGRFIEEIINSEPKRILTKRILKFKSNFQASIQSRVDFKDEPIEPLETNQVIQIGNKKAVPQSVIKRQDRRFKSTSEQTMLSFEFFFFKLLLVLLVLVVGSVFNFLIVRKVAMQIKDYYSFYNQMLDFKERFYRMRFYTVSHAFDTENSTSEASFELLKDAQMLSFKNFRAQLDSNSVSGLSEFTALFKTLNNSMCQNISGYPQFSQSLRDICLSYRIARMGFETFLINISDQFESLFHHPELTTNFGTLEKMRVSTSIMNSVFAILSDELFNAINNGKAQLHALAIFFVISSILVYAICGLTSVCLMLGRMRSLGGVNAWCINLFKSPIAMRNGHFSKSLTNKFKNKFS